MNRLLLLLLLLLLPACTPSLTDDDDAANDDDAVADDDDAANDDDAADDDDAGDDDDDVIAECPLEDELAVISSWTLIRACSDASVSVSQPGDTLRVAMNFQLPNDPGSQVGTTWALYFDDIDAKDEVEGNLLMEEGTNLSAEACNDVPENIVVDARWVAVSGSATLTVTASSGDGYDATVSLVEIVVEEPSTGAVCRIPDVSWPGLRLGWYPG